MTVISSAIAKASEILRNEDLVAIPTETVYGLAGNIYSELAIRKIFQLKQRPLYNPLIVHLPAVERLADIVSSVPEQARLLAEQFWPGPLTLVLKKKSIVPDLITAGKDTVAVRVPNHPLTLQLLEDLDFPLAAPSANPFGSISPTNPNHVKNYFDGQLRMILDGGACQKGIESTIIGFEKEQAILYRLGSIPVEEISKVIGPIQVKNKKEKAPNAPGMLSRHYAPRTPTYLVDDVKKFIADFQEKKIGVLLFDQRMDAVPVVAQEVLSAHSDLGEATARLYAALHQLDELHLDMIVAERFPNRGLGKSINDRLERATKKA